MNATSPILALVAGAALATQVALNGKLKGHTAQPPACPGPDEAAAEEAPQPTPWRICA